MALLPARGNLPPNDLVSSLQSSRSPYISSPTSIGSATSSPFAVPAIVAALAIGAGAYALNQHYTAPAPVPAAPVSVIAPPAPVQTDDSDLKITHEHVDEAESDLESAASQARNDAAAFVPSSALGNQAAAAPMVNFAGSAPTSPAAPTPAPDSARSSMARALASAGPTLSIVSSFVSAGSAAGGDDAPGAGAAAPASVPQQVSFDKNSATTTVTFGNQTADAVPAPTVEPAQSPSMATAPVAVPQLLPQGPGPDHPYYFVETARDTTLEAQVQPWVAQTYSVSVPLTGGGAALVHVMRVKSGNLPVPGEVSAAVAIALERSEFGCSKVPSPSGGASYQEYAALPPNASYAEASTYQTFGRHTASIDGPRSKPFEIWYYGPFTGVPTDGPSGAARVQQGIASFSHMQRCAECKGLLPE